jgi:hypothetical protein
VAYLLDPEFDFARRCRCPELSGEVNLPQKMSGWKAIAKKIWTNIVGSLHESWNGFPFWFSESQLAWMVLLG